MAVKSYQIRLDEEKVRRLQSLARTEAANRDEPFLYTDLLRELIDNFIAKKDLASARGSKAGFDRNDEYMQSVAKTIGQELSAPNEGDESRDFVRSVANALEKRQSK